jgi:uncharacterized membrane protein
VGSLAPPAAFGGALCGTGLGGTFIQPDGPNGTCRLIFDVAKNGGGLSDSVVGGVLALLKSLRLDIRIVAEADQGDLDAVETFVQSIGVNPQGGNDPADPGAPCVPFAKLDDLADFWQGPKGTFKIPDGVNETAIGVTPTSKVCFTITPVANTTIPQTEAAQVYTALLKVRAKNGASPFEIPLGTPRTVAFIVPPSPQ